MLLLQQGQAPKEYGRAAEDSLILLGQEKQEVHDIDVHVVLLAPSDNLV